MSTSFDPLLYPYSSQRMTTYAKNGMVATTQPLAAQAGLDILKKGGNAIDSAIATAAALTVVEPNSNSLGGDSFAIVWTKGKLHGLNSSGPAPKSISIEALKKAGHEQMPGLGVLPVTVPGTPASWAALSKRFGNLPLSEVLRPAIEYAEQGYPLSPVIGSNWNKDYTMLEQQLSGEQFEPWKKIYAPEGRVPNVGEMWRCPDLARTLRSIGETNAESFYRGEIAEQIDQTFKRYGGYLTKEDLAGFEPEWVDPIHVNYRGYDVWELPPNGQGLIALMALNILKEFDFPAKDTIETYHKQIEAIKLAIADGRKYITDPLKMKVAVDDLLSDPYTRLRRALITDKARLPGPGEPLNGDTVYLATADQEGNMVSFIQSQSTDFGSAIVVPGTGICMQNRGSSFSLDPAHHNALEPGKRTYHTIIPGFITKGEQPVYSFGIMSGLMQPQAHVQVVMNLIDFRLNPQAALDAPRWRWIKDQTIHVEPQFPVPIAQALSRMGHDIQTDLNPGGKFGRGQVIMRDPRTGVLVGGTEPRADGAIAVW